MPMVSGLELGKEIRRLDLEAQIIYATTEPQFALLAYADFTLMSGEELVSWTGLLNGKGKIEMSWHFHEFLRA